MTPDAELLRRARTDAHAFRELYDRYAARMFAFHRNRTGDADAAYDLTAETFAQAWQSRKAFRDEAGGSAGPWLFAIARNVLASSVRRCRIERAACERLGVLQRLDREPATAEPTEAWLDDALAGLPDDQQRALELRFVNDLAYADVAASMQTTPGAARVRVHRGLAALRERLTKEER
jgi:RNA polymerase sigma-70 factor (ECF subfamily)